MLQRNLRLNSECLLKSIQARERHGLMDLSAIKVKAKTLTGAGDSWDAANILAHLLELGPTERLLISNAYSALYVMSSDREPATLNKLLKFIKQKYKNIQ